MDEDLRQLAILANKELGRIAENFPRISHGRKALKDAMWQLSSHYLWGSKQKEKIILQAIGYGHRRISDIAAVTNFDRRETCSLIESLVERGWLVEDRERQSGDKGGRPFRIFAHSEKFKSLKARGG